MEVITLPMTLTSVMMKINRHLSLAVSNEETVKEQLPSSTALIDRTNLSRKRPSYSVMIAKKRMTILNPKVETIRA